MVVLGGGAVSYERGTPVIVTPPRAQEAARTRMCSSLLLSSLRSKNNHSTEMCSGSEAGSYLRLIDFVYHSTLGLRVIKKKKSHVPGTGVPRSSETAPPPRTTIRP